MLADIYLAVMAASDLAGIDHDIGAEHLSANAAPPRVVWVPTVDAVDRGQGRRNTAAKEPKSVMTRRAGCFIRCWAKSESEESVDDVRATEQLVNRVLVAIHEAAFGSYEVTAVEWVSSDGAELMQLGRCADIRVAFEVPVTKPASATAQLTVITSAEMEGTADFPTSDVTSTPPP